MEDEARVHRLMIKGLLTELPEEEQKQAEKCIEEIREFFQKQKAKMDPKILAGVVGLVVSEFIEELGKEIE
jgi:hypothetical protein